jgi:hypothetical protein
MTALARVVLFFRPRTVESPERPHVRVPPATETRPVGTPAVPPALPPRAWAAFMPGAAPLDDGTHRDLGTGTGFALNVAGESFRQPALRALDAGRLQRGEIVTFTVDLVPEPHNPHDAHAIRVDIHNGTQVGYLSREDAFDYHDVFAALTAQHLTGTAYAVLIGGVLPDKPMIGALLDVNTPRRLLRALAPNRPRAKKKARPSGGGERIS